MPNHCENDLYIQGSGEDVAAVLALIGEMDEERKAIVDAYGYFPKTPEGVAALAAYKAKYGTEADGFNFGGYEWRVREWGTKWGAYDVKRRDYGGVCVTYQTAWSPSMQIVIALAKKFPAVTFRLEYFECGMQFCGGFSCLSEDDYYGDKPWEAGIVTDEWEGEYCGHRGG